MICIKNGTIHTAVDPQPFTGDILIGGGKILKIASHIDDDYEQVLMATATAYQDKIPTNGMTQ